MNKEYFEYNSESAGCEEAHAPSGVEIPSFVPETETLHALSDFFKIFGDSTRLSILFALDDRELCGCELASALGLTKAVISYQLKVLSRHDLVRSRKLGRRVLYSLSDDHVRDIIEKALDHINEQTV